MSTDSTKKSQSHPVLGLVAKGDDLTERQKAAAPSTLSAPVGAAQSAALLALPSSTEASGAEKVPVERTLRLEDVRRGAGLQVRAASSQETVDDYAEQLKRGAKLPPPTVFYDGTRYWLADGHHTQAAMIAIGRHEAVYSVRWGTRRDALQYALGANQAHGLRLTNHDKRRKVELALADEEWLKWSDAQIADLCRVSDRFVAGVRKELGAASQMRVGKDGRTTNTTNVGRTPSRSANPKTTPATKNGRTPNASESREPAFTVVVTPNHVATDAGVRAPSQAAAVQASPPVDPVDAALTVYDALTPADQKRFHRRLAARRTASKQSAGDRKAAFQRRLAAANAAKQTARKPGEGVDHGRAS